MAYDEGFAQLMRDDLADLDATETKMFGGLCFMVGGHMVCGVHGRSGGSGMARVGKERMAQALAHPGTGPMQMGQRIMGGMVDMRGPAMEEDVPRRALIALALENARSLPSRG